MVDDTKNFKRQVPFPKHNYLCFKEDAQSHDFGARKLSIIVEATIDWFMVCAFVQYDSTLIPTYRCFDNPMINFPALSLPKPTVIHGESGLQAFASLLRSLSRSIDLSSQSFAAVGSTFVLIVFVFDFNDEVNFFEYWHGSSY